MNKEKQRAFKAVQKFLKESKKIPVVIILGPTASGKTAFSIEVAKKFKGEIISADSRQIYKDVDISSAKISNDEMQDIPHHLIDVITPDEILSTQEWKAMAEKKIKSINKKKHLPIVCGGTMLYISALSKNYDFANLEPDPKIQEELKKYSTEQLAKKLAKLDPKEAKKINPKNRRHLIRATEIAMRGGKKKEQKESPFDFLLLGISWPREVLYKRINKRAKEQFESGMIEETKRIQKKYNLKLPALSSFGYEEAMKYIKGKQSLEETIEENRKRNRNYAKRQIAWWKREKNIVWLNGDLLFSK